VPLLRPLALHQCAAEPPWSLSKGSGVVGARGARRAVFGGLVGPDGRRQVDRLALRPRVWLMAARCTAASTRQAGTYDTRPRWPRPCPTLLSRTCSFTVRGLGLLLGLRLHSSAMRSQMLAAVTPGCPFSRL